MKTSATRVLSIWILLLALTSWGASTWYVAVTGTDGTDPWGTSWELPYATISNAVARANTNAGSLVLISNGTYLVTHEITVSNGVICRGFSGDPRDVVVDGGGVTRAFRLTNATLAAVTITNCNPEHVFGELYGDGGGVFCDYNAVVSNCIVSGNIGRMGGGVRVGGDSLVTDCLIVGNVASNRGGGVFIGSGPHATDGARAQILRSIIQENSVVSGVSAGGLALDAGATDVLVESSHIVRNTAENVSGAGGGISDYASSAAFVNCRIISNTLIRTEGNGGGAFTGVNSVYSNCVFAFNRIVGDANAAAYGGGGVHVASFSTSQFFNCLIYSNESKYGAGVFLGVRTKTVWMNSTIVGNTATNNAGGMFFRSGTDTVVNCISYGNFALGASQTDSNFYFGTGAEPVFTNCCIAPVPGGVHDGGGNTDSNPLFVDMNAGLFQLQSDSPCINTGLNQPWMIGASDMDGRLRIDRFSRRVDIGCYEYIPRGSLYGVR